MAEETKNIWADTDDGAEGTAEDHQRIYLEELKLIDACTPEETVSLLKAAESGDSGAGKRLVEGHLMAVARIAGEYLGRGLPVADLIQEANMALVVFAGEYSGDNFGTELDRCVRRTIEEALEMQETEQNIEEEVLARVNVLKDISSSMADELGREATVTELAARMKMTEEEIRDIMKLTLDAMSLGRE